MNLADQPTEAQLATLLAAADDNADSHVLWVDQIGTVHLDPVRSTKQLSGGQPIWFGKEARFRWETFCQQTVMSDVLQQRIPLGSSVSTRRSPLCGKAASRDTVTTGRLHERCLFQTCLET